MILAPFFPITGRSINLFPSFVPSPTSAKLNKCAIVIFGFTIFLTELYFLASSFKYSIFVGMSAFGSS